MTSKLPPLLDQRPIAVRLILAAGVPAAFGVFAGVMLGVSKPAYLLAALLAIGGGYLAGLEHDGAREGLLRGLVGGSLFGGWILIAHGAFFDAEPKAHIPEPAVIHVALTTGFGALLGALGGSRRARHGREEAAATARAVPTQNPNPNVPAWETIVDINTADLKQLQKLPVVGRKAAERIAAHREQHGPFGSVGDLVKVEGFTASRVARLAPRATVSATA
jgi:competence ComEA-like helix-hairpin-helix protein